MQAVWKRFAEVRRVPYLAALMSTRQDFAILHDSRESASSILPALSLILPFTFAEISRKKNSIFHLC